MTGQPIFKYRMASGIVKLLRQLGCRFAVLSPGSRSAPIALAFIREDGIRHYVVPDERSAGFVALGMAKTLQEPVCLVCTSATAVLNYGPAIAEAYFGQVPLIALTADRPAEWIGQQDNQAIHQFPLFGKNILKSWQLSLDDEHPDNIWYTGRIINEAWQTARFPTPGPVHINLPLREPLYENPPAKPDPVKLKPVKNYMHAPGATVKNVFSNSSDRIVVAAGNIPPDNDLHSAVSAFIEKTGAVFLADVASNLQSVSSSIPGFDLMLQKNPENQLKTLKPDLLITFGGAFVSKSLKTFLRQYKAREHFHIDPGGQIIDTFQSLTGIIRTTPQSFFMQACDTGKVATSDPSFRKEWDKLNTDTFQNPEVFVNDKVFSEVSAVMQFISRLPENACLHLGNSLPVRLVSWLAGFLPADCTVYSNRGTSGIDGCVSAACGSAIAAPDKLHFLVCGDMSFMYDRNGLWMKSLPENLRILVLNNHGGGIFRIVPGASEQRELDDYFKGSSPLNVGHTAAQHNINYFYASEMEPFNTALKSFLDAEKCTILEAEFEESDNIDAVRFLMRKSE